LAGQTVGAAEAMCTTNEGRWRKADPYAVRSMAQTRAVSKALRLPLGFIMQLAGYSPTPAEEIDDEPNKQTGAGGSVVEAHRPAPADKRQLLAEVAAEKRLNHSALEEYATLVGIQPGTRATDAQLDALIDAVQGHGTTEPLVIEQAADVVGSDAAAVGPEAGVPSLPPATPPEPGSDEYKALPVQEKAKARAYWSQRKAEENEPPPLNPEQEVLELGA
jgi:hypothetical protein